MIATSYSPVERQEVKEFFLTFKDSDQSEDQEALNLALRRVMPSLKKYISRWIKSAELLNIIPKRKYKADDFLDDLYIYLYDHLTEVLTQDFDTWLFMKVDNMIEEAEVEEEFNRFFYEDIQTFTHQEWDEMEENYFADGRGKLLMEEDFNDGTVSKNDYILKEVFIDRGEDAFIEKLSKKLSKKQLNRHINTVIIHMPSKIRLVYELYQAYSFVPSEIAKIRQISLIQVENYIAKAKNLIRVSLEKRYTEYKLD